MVKSYVYYCITYSIIEDCRDGEGFSSGALILAVGGPHRVSFGSGSGSSFHVDAELEPDMTFYVTV
jgi:hypothetical protein